MHRKYLYRVFDYLLNGSTSHAVQPTFPLHCVDAGVGYAETFFGSSNNSTSIRIMHGTNRGPPNFMHVWFTAVVAAPPPFVGWRKTAHRDIERAHIRFSDAAAHTRTFDVKLDPLGLTNLSVSLLAAHYPYLPLLLLCVNVNGENEIFSRWRRHSSAARGKWNDEWQFDGLCIQSSPPKHRANKWKMSLTIKRNLKIKLTVFASIKIFFQLQSCFTCRPSKYYHSAHQSRTRIPIASRLCERNDQMNIICNL